MSDPASWPSVLQRHAISPTRLRLRPQQAMGGTTTLILLSTMIVAVTVMAAIAQRAPHDLLIGFPLAAFYVAGPFSDRFRWCEIERTPTGWHFAGGIGRRTRWSREVDGKDIMTTCIDLEAGYSLYLADWWSDVLRVELASRPFAGPPPPIMVGRHLVIPRAELEALGALLEGKTIT